MNWARQRTLHAGALLEEAGIAGERISLITYSPEKPDHFCSLFGEIVVNIEKMGRR